MKKLTAGLSGVAGEYLVAGELSRKGYIASITLRNTKGIDILVSNEDATKTVSIQVKTHQGSKSEWMLGVKSEEYCADNLFYVLVKLNDGGVPEYFIVPSKALSKQISDYHKQWLSTPGRKGRVHKDNPMRVFKDPEEKYKNRWDLLKL